MENSSDEPLQPDEPRHISEILEDENLFGHPPGTMPYETVALEDEIRDLTERRDNAIASGNGQAAEELTKSLVKAQADLHDVKLRNQRR